MITILFLVTHNDRVLYPAPSILEVFRIRKILKPPDDAKVYRHVKKFPGTDAYFTWDKANLTWVKSVTGVGFDETSFTKLEPGFKMMGGKL